MQHSFNVNLASKYGILEAILIQNIYYWTLKNKANDKHFHDGYYWTYNSIKAFGELFPYVSERQIQNALKKIKELGIIITNNFNTSPYDKTLWYTISNKGISIMQNCQIETPKMLNRNVENVEPIQYINTYINTYKENNNISKDILLKESDFDEFWKLYPKKVDKAKCLKKYLKINVSQEIILKGVNNYISYLKKEHKEKYIKNPLTWLNGECWNDEYETTLEVDPYEGYTRLDP